MIKEEMILSLRAYFSKHGEYNLILEDVPYGPDNIDLFLLSPDGKYTAVCLDPKYWKPALRRGRNAAFGADYAYVCVPSDIWPKRDNCLFAQQGIGLLLIPPSGSARKVYSPAAYNSPLVAYRKLLTRSAAQKLRSVTHPQPRQAR